MKGRLEAMRGRTGPDEWGKEIATCVAVVGDGMVGMGDMTSCRGGNMR